MEMIKKMSVADRKFLRAEFSKHEGKIDEDVEFECPHCCHVWMADLEYGNMGFFFPTDE